MTNQTEALHQAKQTVLEAWAKKNNRCSCRNGGYRHHSESGKHTCTICDKELPPSITRQMIKELLEEVDEKGERVRDKSLMFIQLQKLRSVNHTEMYPLVKMHAERIVDFAFFTDQQLTQAFHDAFKEG